MKINKKLLYIYTIAFIGFLMLAYYIWYRFIRKRILRDIPFDLTIISFLSISIICMVYIYIIYRIYFPPKSLSILYIFYPYIKIIFKPFYFFDSLIKKSNVFNKNFIILSFKIMKFFNLYKTKPNEYSFILFNTVPKTILLIFFILDIFYFRSLHYFYFALGLSLLPLCYNYIIYLFTQYLNNISNYLDKNYSVLILSTKEEENEYYEKNDDMCFFVSFYNLVNKYNDDGTLDSKIFIEYQSYNLIFDKQLYKYTCIETWFARDTYIKKHNIIPPLLWVYEPESDEISKALIGNFKELMPRAYYFKAFIDTHNDIVKATYIVYDKYILIGYLICWLYILVVSIHTLDFEELMGMITQIKSNEDAFLCVELETINEYEKNTK